MSLVLALAKRPELLLLDESVSALDPLARRAFFQTLMDAVVESETTILFSSHQISDLDRICDSLILLSASRLQLTGSIERLLQEHCWVTCPLGDQSEVEKIGPVLQSNTTNRSCKLIIRASSFNPKPDWDIQAVSLEDMILAYLALPADPQDLSVNQPQITEVEK